MDFLNVAELLAARLCHDLATPIGAASLGVEAVESFPGDAEYIKMLKESIQKASSRLVLIRFLCMNSGNQHYTNGSDFKKIVDSFCEIKATLDIPDRIPTLWAKLTMHLVAIIVSSGSYGGVMFVKLEDGVNGFFTEGSIESDRLIVDEDVISRINNGKIEELTSKTILAFMMLEIAKQLNVTITMNQSKNKLSFGCYGYTSSTGRNL